jgi:hypothetical protein
MWIKDGFITYGFKDWHYFPVKGRISACKMVLAHQRGWENASTALPEDVNKLVVCKVCAKEARKTSVPVKLQANPAAVKCGKVEYFSKTESDIALIHLRSKSKAAGRGEIRSYHCPDCKSWHLTSKS